MADNYNLSDEEINYDLWQQRAPHAVFWLGLASTHSNIEAMCINLAAPYAVPFAPAADPTYPALFALPIGPAYPVLFALPTGPAHPMPFAQPAGPHYQPHVYAPPAIDHTSQAPVPALINISCISLSIPLNTGVVGSIVTHTPLQLPVDLTFEGFFSRVCAHMDLDPHEACIGYKFSDDCKANPTFQLSSEQELRAAMAKGIERMKRAWTREVVMEIFNLEPVQQAASAQCGKNKPKLSTA